MPIGLALGSMYYVGSLTKCVVKIQLFRLVSGRNKEVTHGRAAADSFSVYLHVTISLSDMTYPFRTSTTSTCITSVMHGILGASLTSHCVAQGVHLPCM